MLIKNPKPLWIINGKTKKSVIEGAISQMILCENSTALLLLCVSIYIQVIANIDTKGIAASNAPIRLLLLPTSEITTIRSEVIMSFVM